MRIVVLFFLLIACGPKKAPEPVTQPDTAQPSGESSADQDVRGRIEHAISLLERGKHRDLLLQFIEPEPLAEFKASGELDALVQDFAQNKADNLLNVLRQTRNVDPVHEATDTLIFLLNDTQPLRMRQHDGVWYIMN